MNIENNAPQQTQEMLHKFILTKVESFCNLMINNSKTMDTLSHEVFDMYKENHSIKTKFKKLVGIVSKDVIKEKEKLLYEKYDSLESLVNNLPEQEKNYNEQMQELKNMFAIYKEVELKLTLDDTNSKVVVNTYTPLEKLLEIVDNVKKNTEFTRKNITSTFHIIKSLVSYDRIMYLVFDEEKIAEKIAKVREQYNEVNKTSTIVDENLSKNKIK